MGEDLAAVVTGVRLAALTDRGLEGLLGVLLGRALLIFQFVGDHDLAAFSRRFGHVERPTTPTSATDLCGRRVIVLSDIPRLRQGEALTAERARRRTRQRRGEFRTGGCQVRPWW
jgi:hypothetical protein